MLDPQRSGGNILDVHIHDADFVAYLLGLPRKVFAAGVEDAHGISHVMAEYVYDGQQLILAEGSTLFHAGFPFRMAFIARLERASVELADGKLTVYPAGGEPFTPALPTGDGYQREIAYFLDCVERDVPPAVVTPWDARETIRLIAAEVHSFHSGEPVELAGFTGLS